jgi:2-polyprenyl-3-methyl-5-hydroxy-6-metoxy-1,4-benzoquinol methylase
MNLIERVLHRSGQLVFDPAADAISDRQPESRFTWLRDWIGPRLGGAHVVDVGCWTGRLLAWATGEGASTVVGIDLPGPWLNAAGARLPNGHFYAVTSLERLGASLHSQFDLVFFLETLEHLPRGTEVAALTSIRHLLAPSGWLVMSTPVSGVMAFLDPAWYLVGHRHYSTKSIEQLLKAAGLRVREIRWSGNVWEAVAANVLYVEKHILRRRPRHYAWLARQRDCGLRQRPSRTSTNVWVCAEVV